MKADILFCLPCSRYTLVFFPRFACGSPKLMGPGVPPRLTPPLSGPDYKGHKITNKIQQTTVR